MGWKIRKPRGNTVKLVFNILVQQNNIESLKKKSDLKKTSVSGTAEGTVPKMTEWERKIYLCFKKFFINFPETGAEGVSVYGRSIDAYPLSGFNQVWGTNG